MKPVVVVDLFCGAGGFTQGAMQAGATVALAVDFWTPALRIHHQNMPQVPVIRWELGDLASDCRLIESHLWGYEDFHFHLHGSPPCKELSNASSTDPAQGMRLVNHFLRIVECLKPDSWSMENVVPMRKRLPGWVPSVVLNAADFGVPQTRRRCIAGEGWSANPSHHKDEWVSVIKALPHLRNELTVVLNMVGGGSSTGRRVCSADVDLNQPAKTYGGGPGAPSLRRLGDNPVRVRSLTVNETSILQGFPEDFEWSVSSIRKKDIWTALGNAVCPPVAQAIIRGIPL